MEIIKTLNFLQRLADTFVFIQDMVLIAESKKLKKEVLAKRMLVAKEIVTDRKLYFPDVTEKELSRTIKYFMKKMEEVNRAQIERYHLPLLNQGLVMMCTVFEIFLVHVLRVVTTNKPETLIGICPDKNLSVERIIELKGYDAVQEELRQKVIEHFCRQGIREKLKIFEKLGVDVEKTFDFSHFARRIQKTLSGYNLDKLDEIFQKRHDVVHKDIPSVQTLRELEIIKEFFEKIILNFSIIVSRKFKILRDMQAIVKGIAVSI